MKANGVKYDKLVMLDLPDMKARQKANNHASHKAQEYKANSYNLFVESDLNQAIEINRLVKKPVFCTENFKMIYESESFTYNIKSGKYFPFIRRFAMKIRNAVRMLKGWQRLKRTTVSTSTN